MKKWQEEYVKTLNFYDENAKAYSNRTIKINMDNSHRQFLKYLPNKGKILDAGCGSGRDAKKFLNLGYEVVAFDASIEMVKLAQKLLKQPVLHLTFENITFQNEFDGIWCSASLLHIPSYTFLSVLKKLCQALKIDGTLFFSLKSGSFEGVIKKRFFNYFTKESLNSYIKKVPQLEFIEMWEEQINKNDPVWLQYILKKRAK